ncbi:MAG: acireductone dioxygenase [Myxococcota bacterium]|nr:acireductone dioxygenase [Myxococcota bacterium]
MAKLQTQDGQSISDLSNIQRKLQPLNVQLRYWPTNPDAAELLQRDVLSDDEKKSLIDAHDHYFSKLQQEEHYQQRDLIVLHPNLPQLSSLLEKFARIHTHDDDEVRYIIDGEGVFGFVMPDESQILLTVESGEYINVPKDTEHWFLLTEAQRIKALRYFTSTEGWSPRYTNRSIRI